MISPDELSDRLNPVLIKEMRQSFHSRLMLVVMAFLMLGELLMLFIIQMDYSTMVKSTLANLGRISFSIQMTGVSIAIFALCVFQLGAGFSQERGKRELDYSRLSNISAFSVVFGKMCSSFVMMVYIYSMCLPFMLVAYYLRGISVGSMVSWVLVMFPLYLCYASASLFIGSFGVRGLNALVMLLLWPCIVYVSRAVYHMSSSTAWVLVRPSLFLLLLTGMLVSYSVAIVSAGQSNRMFGPRLYCVVSAVAVPLFGVDNNVPIIYFVMLCMMSIPVVWERFEAGRRVMLERPRSRLLRVMKFPLCIGKASGLVLCWGLILLLLLLQLLPNYHTTVTSLPLRLALAGMYIMFYVQLTVLFERWFLTLKPLAILLIVLEAFLLLPQAGAGLFKVTNNVNISRILTLFTPMSVLGDDCVPERIWPFPVSLSLLTLLALMPYILRQLRAFVLGPAVPVSGERK